MNKKCLVGILAACAAFVLPISCYAADFMENERDMSAVEMTDERLLENIFQTGVSFHRGEVISHIEAGLDNYGFGVAHVSGEVFCHHPVEAIHIRLMLQKWNEDYRQWENVNTQDFEWNAEDLPAGEELTCAYINYNIPGCESGSVYRTKGIFGAWDEEFDDAWLGYSEGLEF